MKLVRDRDVEAAAKATARTVKAQIATPAEAEEIVLTVFRTELPELFLPPGSSTPSPSPTATGP